MSLPSHPSRGATPSSTTMRIVVEDYYDAEPDPAATSLAASASAQPPMRPSAPLLLSVSGAELVSEVVRRYRVHTQRYALRDPVVFLAHPAQQHDDAAAAATAAAAAHVDPVAATPIRPAVAVPAIPSSSVVSSAATLLARVRGKRVQLSPRDVASCSLVDLCVRDGSVLTVRSRPFPLRVLVDNTALVRAGVPHSQLDWHASVVWAEERTSVRQLRDEYVRQVRENPALLGCDRHRFFVRPARAPLHDSDQKDEDEEEEEDTADGDVGAAGPHAVSVPSDALEITLDDARLLQSLPLRSGSVVWVQKDPSRWLSDAVRAGDEQRAQKLIDLGADAHLLDARGHSAFFYAQQLALQRAAKADQAETSTSGDVRVHNSMQLLLRRNFPPSPLESQSLRVLLSSYAGWLATGACVQKHTIQWVREGDVREFSDYAFVHSGVNDPADQLRPVINERHKLLGYVNLRRGFTGGTLAEPQGNAVAPYDLHPGTSDEERTGSHEPGVQMASLPSSSSPTASRPATATAASVSPPSPRRRQPQSGGPGPGASAKGMWASYNHAPETLLFDVQVSQPDRVAPVTVFLRSPQFPTPTASNQTVNALQRVTRFRSLVTRFDVFKNAYMMNLKLAMLVVSAASAFYSFAFSGAAGSGSIAQQYWIQGELRAIFALTMLKAAAAALFMLRTALPQRTLHFPRIKSHLLLEGHELYAAECWLYFLALEAADAGMIVCNVRILSSLMAGVGGHVSLYPSDLHPNAPPLSEAQSLLLSILTSLLSLVSLNLLDTLISFLADETPRMSAKVRRYLLLHLPVLIQCFAALRLCFDLREMRLSSALADAETDPSSSSSSLSRSVSDATTGFLSYLTPTTLAFLFAYLCGLSLKNLQVLFHPPMNHALADEKLGAAAMDTDSKASLIYVVLACVVYGAAQNPSSDTDRQMIRELEEGVLFPLALAFYFASAVVLAVTALLPFMLRAVDGRVVWAPPMLSKAAEQLEARVRAFTCRRRLRVASRSPSVLADEADHQLLLQAPTDETHPHAD